MICLQRQIFSSAASHENQQMACRSFIIRNMTGKDELKTSRILIAAVLILTAVIAVFLFLLQNGDHRPAASSDPDTIGQKAALASQGAMSVPSETSEMASLGVSVNDYRVFALDGLGFRFVIANVHVSGTSPLNVPLSHFTTSEGIRLDQVQDYVNALEEKNLFLGRQNVMFSLISETSPLDANLFIPVKDASLDSVTVSADFQKQVLSFSLKEPKGTEGMLTYTDGDVITDGRTYQMTVSKAREITGEPLYQTVNGEDQEYLLPSTTKVYAFQVDAVSLYGDTISLDSAQYVPENSSEVFEALPAEIHTLKFRNMLGQTISDTSSGYLFFYAYDPEDHPITYTGVLKLKVSGQNTWITVNVDLNE